MGMQFSVDVRNARLDAIETTIGPSARLMIYTGTKPIACSSGSSGLLLATIVLPSNYMDAAVNGSKTKSAAAWTADATMTGTAGYFRFKDSSSTVTHVQGTITVVGGSGDMWLDSVSLVTGQPVTVSTCVWTEGGE